MSNPPFPIFNPTASFKAASTVFSNAGVSHFALIGKLAMWVYLDDISQHQFTSDVDFAVRLQDAEKLEAAIIKEGLAYEPLAIGGLSIRTGKINLDLMAPQSQEYQTLFAEAIESATRQISVEDVRIPVVSLEHLVALKMVSGEPKQDRDLKILVGLKSLDYAKAKNIVTQHLGSTGVERLDKFAQEVGDKLK